MWALHARLLARGVVPDIPAPVLAQAWRGGPQAALSRLIKTCRVVEMDERLARAAGATCAQAGTSDVVDASAAVLACARSALLVTTDTDDLRRLVGALGGQVVIKKV